MVKNNNFQGLEQNISNTKSIYGLYDGSYDEIMNKLKENVDDVVNSVKTANKATIVSQSLAKFNNLITNSTKKVVEINERYETHFNLEINRIYSCNLRYLKAIKYEKHVRELCSHINFVELGCFQKMEISVMIKLRRYSLHCAMLKGRTGKRFCR